MVESPKFLLNVAPLSISYDNNWRIFEIETADWDPDKIYSEILSFRRELKLENFLVENHGRLLVIIPKRNDKISVKEIETIKSELKQFIGQEVNFESQEIPSSLRGQQSGLIEAIKKGLGEIITYELENKGFKKISSGGSVGNFLPPKNWINKAHEELYGDIKFFRTLNFVLNYNISDDRFYLAIDVKGGYRSTQTLDDWLSKNKLAAINPDEWKKGDNNWRAVEDSLILQMFPKDILNEVFEVKSLIKWSETKDKTIDWGKYRTKTLSTFIKENQISAQIENYTFAVLKPRERIIKNPNIELIVPIQFLYRHLSQPSTEEGNFSEAFKKYTKISMEERYRFIEAIFQDLIKKNLILESSILKSYEVTQAHPTVRSNTVREYGFTPRLNNWGVEEWGPLRNIVLFCLGASKVKAKVEEFRNELRLFIDAVISQTPNGPKKISMSIEELPRGKIQWNKLCENVDEKTSCIVVFVGREAREYNKIKESLTQERRIPVQVIRENTLLRGKLNALVRTVFPQLIAKSGGLPYRLAPPILDRALLIGLDKARDSSGKSPSASAGVAAVTPEGRYVSGASTKMEKNTTDFIDVDVLAPDLLQELKQLNFSNSYDYVVILRDGSPQTCQHEVEQWKHHLEPYNMKFIFLACRKTHPYRIFPEFLIQKRESNLGQKNYPIPLVLNGKPLPESDFLVLAARSHQGTPKPVLYTLMENTTGLSQEIIKTKVLAQVVSLSMLCWESPFPTSQPLPLHYADKLAAFTQIVQQKWNTTNRFPMFI